MVETSEKYGSLL